MVKLTTKEDVALLVEEASEMFEETGCVPDVDGKKVRAEKIVSRAKRYVGKGAAQAFRSAGQQKVQIS